MFLEHGCEEQLQCIAITVHNVYYDFLSLTYCHRHGISTNLSLFSNLYNSIKINWTEQQLQQQLNSQGRNKEEDDANLYECDCPSADNLI